MTCGDNGLWLAGRGFINLFELCVVSIVYVNASASFRLSGSTAQ